jgi:hypothetical protein
MDKILIKKINKRTLVVLPILTGVSWLFFNSWLATFNVILGGLISWLSLNELFWAVKKFFGKPMFQVAIIGLSYIKIGIIFLFLWFLAMHGLFNLWGMITGFFAVLILSTLEAYFHVRRHQF